MCERIGAIYRWTNTITGKTYIGQTRLSPEERKSQYFTEISRRPIILALRKYGHRNFLFEVLTRCPIEQLDDLEQEYIAIHNSTNRLYGYNVLLGGQKNRLSKYDSFITKLDTILSGSGSTIDSEKIVSLLEDAKMQNQPNREAEVADDSFEQKILLSLISFFCHYSVDDIMILPLDTWLSFASFEVSDAYTFKKNKDKAYMLLHQSGWWKSIKTNMFGDIVEEKLISNEIRSNFRKFTWANEETKVTALQYFEICRFYMQQAQAQ